MTKRSFYLIVLSQGIGLIGGAATRFAISLHVLDITGSAEIFATMVAISFLPWIFVQPIGGVLADRFSKKRLLVMSDSMNTVLVGALAVLLFSGSHSVLLFGAIITMLTVVATCYHPTVTASLPLILNADELPKANGIVQGLKAISTIAGPVFAGFLFAAIGVNNLVAVCATIFLISAVLNIFIKIPHTPQERKAGIISTIINDLKDGFAYITKDNPLLFKMALLYACLMLFFQAMMSVTFPYMIRVTFEMNEELFGFANAAVGAAMLLGSFISGRVKNYTQTKNIPNFMFVMAGSAIPIAISAALPSENSIAPFLLLTGGFMLIMFIFTSLNIMIMTHTQTHTPKHMVGKSVGIILGIANLTAPIGQLSLGRLIEWLADAQFVIYLVVAVITFALGVIAKKRLIVA